MNILKLKCLFLRYEMGEQFSMSKVFDHASKMIKAYHNQLQPLCKEYDMPPLALDILLFIANNPDNATAKDICIIRGAKPGIVSVHIERLVEYGLLERATVKGDRRKNYLTPTVKADEIIAKGRFVQKFFAERLSQGVNDDDFAVWKRIIETIDKNLESLSD